MTIRVLLAEDQGMVRSALAALLALHHDIEVVAQVGSGDEVVPAALEHAPDVALLDIEMPGMDGLAAAAALPEAMPGCRVLILTTFGRPGYLRRAMDAGAYGFLVKDGPTAGLAAAIRRAAAGQRTVDPGLASAALVEGSSPLSERRARGPGRRPAGRHDRRHRRQPAPVRGHRPQSPVSRDPQDPHRQPPGGRSHRRGEGPAATGNDEREPGRGPRLKPGTLTAPTGWRGAIGSAAAL